MSKKNTFIKILCFIFILSGVYILVTNLIKQARWEKTTGLVLAVKEKKSTKNQFYPVVAFTTETGENVQVEIFQSSNRFYYKKGEDIPIIYPINNAQEAEINSIAWVYGFPAIFIVIGVIGFFIPNNAWYRS